MLKVLNLYAGIGGNRKLWQDVEVTAVEIDPDIASIYRYNYPNDRVIVTDAHEYLINHFTEFDFIWSSPPCPSHSRLCFSKKEKTYAEMSLYQEIILLQSWYKGLWAIENVVPYYEYLIKPSIIIGRHPYWSNFHINKLDIQNIDVARSTAEELSEYLDMPIPRINARLLLRNCVEPKVGKHIFDCAMNAYKPQTNYTEMNNTLFETENFLAL